MCSAFSRFVYHLLRIGVRLSDDFLITLLRFGEFLFDFFGINLAFLDLAPTLLEHSKDWFVSEALQKVCNDAEANDLRQKQLPIPAEGFSCFAQDVGDASAAGGDNQVHKLSLGRNTIAPRFKLVNEIKGVENDRLGQRNGENSVHEHLRERTGIATDRACHSQAGQADS